MLNMSGSYELPNILRRGVLEKLKARYLEREDGADEEGLLVTHSRTAGMATRRKSNVGGTRPFKGGGQAMGFMAEIARKAAERAGDTKTRQESLPGDILSSVPLHMGTATSPTGEPVDTPKEVTGDAGMAFAEEGDEDEFRDAVLDCMFKAIGLSAVDNALNPVNGSSSIEASPVSYPTTLSVKKRSLHIVPHYLLSQHSDNIPSLPHHRDPNPRQWTTKIAVSQVHCYPSKANLKMTSK